MNGLDAPKHGGGDDKQAARLVILDLAHDTERGPQADGHHGRVLEDVMLLAQDQRGDRKSEEWRGGVDHLSEGQLHIVQTHVAEGDAGAKRKTQQEDFTLSPRGQLLLHRPFVADHSQFDQAVVHHDGCQHVQSGQQQGVPEVVHGKDPFVEAGDGGAGHEPNNDRREQMEHLCRGSPIASRLRARIVLGEAISVDHDGIIVLAVEEVSIQHVKT